MSAAIFQRFQTLFDAAAAATAGDPATLAEINAIAAAADNLVEVDDGFERFSFDASVGDATFLVSFDAATDRLTLKNLATGVEETEDLGAQAIAADEMQTVRFDTLGATVLLNNGFDKTTDIDPTTGSTAFLDGQVAANSFTFLSVSGDISGSITANDLQIDATDASLADLTIGGFSASGVDLSNVGTTQATLTDGANSFMLSFELTTAVSDGETGGVDVDGFGAMAFAIDGFATPGVTDPLAPTFTLTSALNQQASGANALEAADGFAAFAFENAASESAFALSYDAGTGFMSLRNLTTGASASVDIDNTTPVAGGGSQDVDFASLGATVTLNDAFDKATDIGVGATVASVGGTAAIAFDTDVITSATGSAADQLTTTNLVIDATDAGAAVFSIGDFTSEAVNLSATGAGTATLSNGVESFEVAFEVQTAFSDGDDAQVDLAALGELAFAAATGTIAAIGTARADGFDGTPFADNARGGGDNDGFNGLAGDDTLVGHTGVDFLNGGSGDDFLTGGPGNDVLEGVTGANRISGDDGDDAIRGGGIDTIFGRAGDDAILAGVGADVVLGGADNDHIAGEDGDDRLYGEAGLDEISGGAGADFIKGGTGVDTLHGDAGADVIVGDEGDDTINGGDGDDRLYGLADDDTLNGDAGDDFLKGQAGVDTLNGGAGEDKLNGGGDNDIMNGGDDIDRLRGGGGNDTLNGGNGDDAVFGEDGSDVISGGAGFDILVGGAGVDLFRFLVGAEVEKIADFVDGTDRIDMSGHAFINNFSDLLIFDVGANTKIVQANDPTNPDFIVLVGISSTSISASDFQFLV